MFFYGRTTDDAAWSAGAISWMRCVLPPKAARLPFLIWHGRIVWNRDRDEGAAGCFMAGVAHLDGILISLAKEAAVLDFNGFRHGRKLCISKCLDDPGNPHAPFLGSKQGDRLEVSFNLIALEQGEVPIAGLTGVIQLGEVKLNFQHDSAHSRRTRFELLKACFHIGRWQLCRSRWTRLFLHPTQSRFKFADLACAPTSVKEDSQDCDARCPFEFHAFAQVRSIALTFQSKVFAKSRKAWCFGNKSAGTVPFRDIKTL